MAIPTSKVVISFSASAMSQYLKDASLNMGEAPVDVPGTFESENTWMLDAEGSNTEFAPEHLNTPDVFTFTNASIEEGINLQVTEFIHSYAYQEGAHMKMKLIDPSRKFEEKILSMNVGDDLASYAVRYTGTKAKTKPDPHYQQKLSAMIDVEETLNKITNPEAKDAISKKIQELREIRKNRNKKMVYVSYGMGSNPDAWSGPHAMFLNFAQLIPERGARQLKIDLTGIPSSVKKQHRKNSYGKPATLPNSSELLITGFSERFEGIHPTLQASNRNQPEYTGKGIEDTGIFYGPKTRNESFNIVPESPLQSKALETLNNFTQFVDMHLIITDTIRDFVAKSCGNPRVIVLMPDLNFVLGPLIYKTLQEVGWSASLQNTDPYEHSRKAMAAVDKILKGLGIHLQKYPRIIEDRVPELQMNGAGKVARFQNAERVAPSEAYDHFATIHSTRVEDGEMPETASIVSPSSKIKSIFDNINEKSRERYSGVYNILSETDSGLISLWTSLGKEGATNNETSLGYSAPNKTFENLVDVGDDQVGPALLVGSLSMINEFLYAKKELSNEYLENIEKLFSSSESKPIFEAPPEMSAEDWDLPHPPGSQDSAMTLTYSTQPAIMRGFAHWPLHPSDNLLGDIENNKKIRDYVISEHEKADMAFGQTQDLPDEFAFAETEKGKQAMKRIRDSGIPVFKYNTSDPNVLNIKADYNPMYYAQLSNLSPMVHWVNNSSSRVAAPGGGVPATQETASYAELAARTQVNLQSRGVTTKYLKSVISDSIAKSTGNPAVVEAFASDGLIEELAPLVVAWQQVDKDNPLNVSIRVGQGECRHAASYAWMDFITNLYQSVKQIKLTTLPMYYYSMGNMLFQECVLFSQFPQIRQTNEPEYSPLDAFLSGIYVIVGFQHTISSRVSYSEFKLVKAL